MNNFIAQHSFSIRSPLLNWHYSYPNHHSNMQSIELFNLNSSNLHLTSFFSIYSLSKDVNPLNYQLTVDHFITLMQPNSQILYTLDPSTTTSLFWALHCLAWYIVRDASHDLHNDPSILLTSKGYISQFYFHCICISV